MACRKGRSRSSRSRPKLPPALFLSGTYRGASPRLTAITWGAEDLSAELGAETNRDAAGRFTSPYFLARNLSLARRAAARVQPIDTVYADFRNMEGLREESLEARRDGFTAKMAIHPAQVAIINEVFTPTPEMIAWRARLSRRLRQIRRPASSRSAA